MQENMVSKQRFILLTILCVGFFCYMTFTTIIGKLESSTQEETETKPPNQLRDKTVKPFLTLFTTFKNDPSKLGVYTNTLRNWKALNQQNVNIRTILFYAGYLDNKLKTLADELGWDVVKAPKTNKYGTPYLKEMYVKASSMYKSEFYGYSNGDILFGQGLKTTLEGIYSKLKTLNRTLVIGIRTNVLINNRIIFNPEKVDAVAKTEGELFNIYAEDYFFIANNEFPWDKTPDLVVGRIRNDNFIVSLALKSGMSVIDATKTLTALHQTDKEGNQAGHNENNPDASHNIDVMGDFDWARGLVNNSQYISDFVDHKSKFVKIIKKQNHITI